MTSSDLRTLAETRLEQAAANLGLADPRPALRDRLRSLKEGNPGAFDQARAHYEQTVLPALASGENPLDAWAEYARVVGGLTASGRLTGIHEDGRAAPYTTPLPGLLVLYIPEDTAEPVLVALPPKTPSAAQQAAIDLLVNRRLSL